MRLSFLLTLVSAVAFGARAAQPLDFEIDLGSLSDDTPAWLDELTERND